MESVYRHFLAGFERCGAAHSPAERRIGAELKFPLVNRDGTAAGLEKTCALWEHLASRGWEPVRDGVASRIVGAKKPGPQNATVASCETGFCKPEFSLAHVGDLFEMERSVRELREELAPFCDAEEVLFLGYGIQPITPPSKRLLMKKTRTSVWDKVFGANRCLCREDGDDVCLFTVNAGTHVHASVTKAEAVDAVNVLNGFTGPQLALSANSNIWRGQVDPAFKCVSEKLWDWWMPDKRRVGIPARPFRDLRDYVETVAAFRPVYVKRDGAAILLTRYRSFQEYFGGGPAIGVHALDGREVAVDPEHADIDLHSTCYWSDARLSRYYTVENRANDQQPPEDLLCISALTLGLLGALRESLEVLRTYEWPVLRKAREAACRSGLAGRVDGLDLAGLAGELLDLAELGLRRRGLGEQRFLAPLHERLRRRECPADEASRLFTQGGIESLVAARRLSKPASSRVAPSGRIAVNRNPSPTARLGLPPGLVSVREAFPTVFVEAGTTDLRSREAATVARVNDALFEALGAVAPAVDGGQALLKVHIGEPKCSTRMRPEYAEGSVRFLQRRGVSGIVAGDTTVAYSGPRGHKQNPPGNVRPYQELAARHGWSPSGPAGVPFVVLDRPSTAIPGCFEFDKEEIRSVRQVGDPSDRAGRSGPAARFGDCFLAGGFAAADFVVNYAHLTLHGLAGVAACVKSVAMGCSSLRGKLRMHQSLVPGFDGEACAGCGGCVESCPEAALRLPEGGPPVVDSESCIGCGECEAVCARRAVRLTCEDVTDWQRGEHTLPARMADSTIGLMAGRWESTVHVLQMVAVTERCDCLDVRQRPMLEHDLGFLVGRNPFAIDLLAARLLAERLPSELRAKHAASLEAAARTASSVHEAYGVLAETPVETIPIRA